MLTAKDRCPWTAGAHKWGDWHPVPTAIQPPSEGSCPLPLPFLRPQPVPKQRFCRSCAIIEFND